MPTYPLVLSSEKMVFYCYVLATQRHQKRREDAHVLAAGSLGASRSESSPRDRGTAGRADEGGATEGAGIGTEVGWSPGNTGSVRRSFGQRGGGDSPQRCADGACPAVRGCLAGAETVANGKTGRVL